MSLLAESMAMSGAAIAGAVAVHCLYAARAERDRAESEENLRNLADSVPQVLWQGLPDGRVTFMNLRWTEVTGASVAEGLQEDGWAWKNWFHPDDRQGLLDDWDRARSTGKQFDSYRRLSHSDGIYRWVQVTARPIRDASGTIIRWYGVSTDIDTEMKAQMSVSEMNQTLEQRVEERTRALAISERRYRLIFERSHVALFEQNLDALIEALSPLHKQHGPMLASFLQQNPATLSQLLQLLRTEKVNAAAIEFLGKDRQTLLTHSRPGVVEPGPFARLLQLIAEGQEDQWEGEVSLLAGDGSVKKALCGVTLMRSPDAVHAFTHLSDITDREQTRELLLKTRDELALANRALTVGALSMSLAHDLGQPISAITIDATVARRALDKAPHDVAGASKAMDRIISSARRAAILLNRTREQADRRERSVEQVEAGDAIRASIGLLEHEIRMQDCRISLDIPDGNHFIAADRLELQQVLINLVLNAITASKGSSSDDTTIEVSLTVGDKSQMIIEVRDAGVGLPHEGQDRIFDPLYSTRRGGMGMGLSICRTIVQSFGGHLTASNNTRGGATFAFTVPRS